MKNTNENQENDPPPKVKHTKTDTLTSRLLYFIEKQGISKRKFYEKAGLSNGLLDKTNNLGSTNVEKVLYAFPQLNPNWVLTGTGEMLKNGSLEENIVTDPGESYANQFKRVPVFDVDVFAGNTSLVNTIIDEAIIGWARMPGYEDCIGWVRARGDSMTPLIKPNDLIAVLPQVNKKYILWGSMYIVTFEGDMAPHPMIKYVHEGSDGIIILRSLNTKYSDMKIKMDDIKALYPTRAGIIEF